MELTHKEALHVRKKLEREGVPENIFMRSDKCIDLEDYTVEIVNNEDDRMIIRRVSEKNQINGFSKLMDTPFKLGSTTVISSFPSDSLSKRVALCLFARAYVLFRENKPSRLRDKEYPYWHTLYGGYNDRLLNSDRNPSFLVISNVFDNSSGSKTESIQDIMEKYNKIPKVITTASADPLSFLMKIRKNAQNFLYLGPGKHINNE